jgi:uncharacterized OB-fold protein
LIFEQFINGLRKRRFALPYCIKCDLPAWPPVDRCYHCMSRVGLREIRFPVGRLLEYTTARNISPPVVFGIVSIDGIKVIGSLDSSVSPRVGIDVKMTNCGISSDGTPFYEFDKYEKRK